MNLVLEWSELWRERLSVHSINFHLFLSWHNWIQNTCWIVHKSYGLIFILWWCFCLISCSPRSLNLGKKEHQYIGVPQKESHTGLERVSKWWPFSFMGELFLEHQCFMLFVLQCVCVQSQPGSISLSLFHSAEGKLISTVWEDRQTQTPPSPPSHTHSPVFLYLSTIHPPSLHPQRKRI